MKFEILWVKNVVDFFVANFLSIFHRKNRLKICHQKLHQILHCKREICHLELALGAFLPNSSGQFCSAEWHGRFAMRFARIDSRGSFAIETPIFIARQADSHESLEIPIRANHATKLSRRGAALKFHFARLTLSYPPDTLASLLVLTQSPPKTGRKTGAAHKLSKSVEIIFNYFWHFLTISDVFCPARKIVEKCRNCFWHFSTIFDFFYPARKFYVEKCRKYFGHFLTIFWRSPFPLAPSCGPLVLTRLAWSLPGLARSSPYQRIGSLPDPRPALASTHLKQSSSNISF